MLRGFMKTSRFEGLASKAVLGVALFLGPFAGQARTCLTSAEVLVAPFEQWGFDRQVPRPRELEELLREQGKEHDWFQMSFEIEPGKLDPFYVKVLEVMNQDSMILGPGSDVPQILMGQRRLLRDGGVTEINLVSDPGLDFVDAFRSFENFVYPEFGARRGGTLSSLQVNNEGTLILRALGQEEKQMLESHASWPGPINVPFKGDVVVWVSRQGQARLFFRRPEAALAYQRKHITVPNPHAENYWSALREKNSPTDFRAQQEYTVTYVLRNLARGQDLGWDLAPETETFLLSTVNTMTQEQRQKVLDRLKPDGFVNARILSLLGLKF
jgi:hypothetical protein